MTSPTNSFAAKKLLLAYTKTDGPSTVRNPIVQQLLVRLVSAIPSIFRDRYEATMLESLFTMMYVALLRISEVSYTPKLAIIFAESSSFSHTIKPKKWSRLIWNRANSQRARCFA